MSLSHSIIHGDTGTITVTLSKPSGELMDLTGYRVAMVVLRNKEILLSAVVNGNQAVFILDKETSLALPVGTFNTMIKFESDNQVVQQEFVFTVKPGVVEK